MRWRSPSPEATRALARALAAAVDAGGLVVALIGPLGAGKTVFAKGLGEGLGLDPERVLSPSFVIASEYPLEGGPLRLLAHVDCHRLRSAAELEAAGFADLLAPGVLVAVEWGDRFPEALPEDRLEVRIGGAPGSRERVLEARALGPAARGVLARWRAGLARDPVTRQLEGEPAE